MASASFTRDEVILALDVLYSFENTKVIADSKDHCEICNSKPTLYYRNVGLLLQNHLSVAPTLMDYSEKYTANSFLTVCPTCHAALHRYRPWLTKENCGDVLR